MTARHTIARSQVTGRFGTPPLSIADLNRAIAHKLVADLAAADPTAFKDAAAHTAPGPATHTPPPRLPRADAAHPGPITMFEPAGAGASTEAERLAYQDGWYWGTFCGTCATLCTIIVAVAARAWMLS